MRFIGYLLFFLVLVTAVVFGVAACFMQAVAVAHDNWIPAIPTIGYWPAVELTALLLPFAGLLGGASASRSNR